MGAVFQFLIVRLKLSGGVITFNCNMVSIPYSTIKISSPTHIRKWKWVSIPYSTIKIEEVSGVTKDEYVSIPYSTIKIRLHYYKNKEHHRFNSL